MENARGRADRDGPIRQTVRLQDLQAGAGLVPRTKPRTLEEEERRAQGRIQAAGQTRRRRLPQSSGLARQSGGRPPGGARAARPGRRTAGPAGRPPPGRAKKKPPAPPALVDDPLFAEPPANHGYPVGVIALFLGLVRLGVSLRAASRVLDLIARAFGLPSSAPDWTTGRMWLLRFGLAQLDAPKDRAVDWAWLIDHSVQIGTQKVLAIVGIRLLALPMPERPLRPDDLVLIDLVPMEASTREDIAACLEDAARRTA